MFGILADRHVNPVFPEDRGGNDLARAAPSAHSIGNGLAILHPVFGRVAIVPPKLFQDAALAFFDRFRIEGVTDTVAAAKEDELLASYFPGRGGAVKAVK